MQLFFGVPVSMQEESFLSLAAISCFFADSDDEGARTKTKERRGRAFMADSDESEDGGLRLSRSAGKRNRQRDKLPHDDVSLSKTSADQGGRKRSFSDVSANDHTVKGKASRRSTSGAPAPAEQKRKEKKDKKRDKKKADKSKRHKAGKVWALDNLPELPGLEYIKANLYKYPLLRLLPFRLAQSNLKRQSQVQEAQAGASYGVRVQRALLALPVPVRSLNAHCPVIYHQPSARPPTSGAQMECCHSSSAEDPCKCSGTSQNWWLSLLQVDCQRPYRVRFSQVQEPTADEGKGCSHRGGEDNEEGMLFCLSTDTAATFVTPKRLTSLILRQGYGVIADATIKPRSLIIEYVGEVRGNSAVLVRLNAQLSADRKFMC